MWYRIFTAVETEPSPEAILAHLNRFVVLEGHFRGDEGGWFHADLVYGDKTLSLDRYLSGEEGVRAELNTWAASVEAHSGGEQTQLMERLIQTKQLFALHGPEAGIGRVVCLALCEFLAHTADGIYQLDGVGFCAADGTLLWREG